MRFAVLLSREKRHYPGFISSVFEECEHGHIHEFVDRKAQEASTSL